MSRIWKRTKVVLRAAPTYLVAGATIVTIVTEEVGPELPTSQAEWIVRIGGKVVAVLGAAVAIIRRVTPVVDAAERGLLPPAER